MRQFAGTKRSLTAAENVDQVVNTFKVSRFSFHHVAAAGDSIFKPANKIRRLSSRVREGFIREKAWKESSQRFSQFEMVEASRVPESVGRSSFVVIVVVLETAGGFRESDEKEGTEGS